MDLDLDLDLGASAAHERKKLDVVEDAAAVLRRAVVEERRARDARDRAVRAAVKAGVRPGRVAKAAGISAGRVTHITLAPCVRPMVARYRWQMPTDRRRRISTLLVSS